jgi:putative ABC transport system permease protein
VFWRTLQRAAANSSSTWPARKRGFDVGKDFWDDDGNLLQDVKHSFRSFRRSPGFTLTAVGALAIGIGANTAIFSVVNTVLLRPLRYPDPGRIVQFLLIRSGLKWLGASATKFNLWREQTSILQDISAYRLGSINLTGGASPEQIPMAACPICDVLD